MDFVSETLTPEVVCSENITNETSTPEVVSSENITDETSSPEVMSPENEKIAALEQEISLLKDEIVNLSRQKVEIEITRLEKSKKLEELNFLVDNLKIEVLSKTMFDDVKTIEGFELISPEEQILITKGIDKTDYTSYGKPRWMDLERVINKIITVKTKYPGWVLTNLNKSKIGKLNISPRGFSISSICFYICYVF